MHPDARRARATARACSTPASTPARRGGAESVTGWLLADDERTRAFLAASGLAPDGAYRDRVVSPDGDSVSARCASVAELAGAA